jgi:hypothetical protein
MKNILILVTISVFIFSCEDEKEQKNLTYQNLIILSDMSSRIDNKPQKDITEIKKILDYFKQECVKPGEKIGDRSSILFTSFSDKKITSIDLNEIKNLGEKQQFINSTGKYKNKGLSFEIKEFDKKVWNSYKTIRNNGLDLISILQEKIQNQNILKENTLMTDGIDTTFVNFENHIYIFTDGYLEYANENSNGQYYFGNAQINNIRTFCKLKNIDVATALKINKSLGLPEIKNAKNERVALHLLETHERDKNDELMTYKYTSGFRDNDILEQVWKDWAKRSGFKTLIWEKY